MALVSDSIPNLINGVSQQPYALRLPSQADEQVNFYSSVVEGLRRRPATNHIAKLYSGTLPAAAQHLIDRDISERYQVLAMDEDLKVYDLVSGTAKTVTFANGTGYLASTNPKVDFRFLTVADYTFVLNTSVEVQALEELSSDRGVEAIVFVKQANYLTDYRLKVDGTEVAQITTSSSGALRTSTIASDMKTAAEGNLGSDFELEIEGSVIHIKRVDGADFEIKASDSRANQNIFAAKTRVQRFSELPTVAPTGFAVEIVGDQTSNFDNYYVKFVPNNETADFDTGVWEETVKPGIPWKLDPATMPHALVREADGTFTFKQLEWGERAVGDEESAPDPTFVGRKINDVFFYENRLGLLADENSVMSRAGEFFEFYPSTVTTLLDSDPIDKSASTNRVAILRHAVPFNEELLLFADSTQFTFSQGDVLSPKDARVPVLTEFESDMTAKPVGAGKTVFFVINKGQYDGLREFYIESETSSKDAADITSHVPKYIPDGVYKMTASKNEEVIFALTDGEPNAIYVYKFFWSGNEKLQSSWSKFKIGTDDTKILAADFLDSTCYLVVQYSDGVYLESMSLAPGQADPDAPFEFHMDRKVTEADCVSVTYDSNTNTTAIVLPYVIDETPRVVSRYVEDMTGKVAGVVATIESTSGSTVTVRGDWSSRVFFVGSPYTSTYVPSTPIIREASDGGGQSMVSAGRLQIKHWTFVYSSSGYFRVTVQPSGNRDASIYRYTGKTLGSSSTVLGQIPIASGRFKFPVMARNDQFTITVETDSHLPVSLISAEWEGTFSIRSKRL